MIGIGGHGLPSGPIFSSVQIGSSPVIDSEAPGGELLSVTGTSTTVDAREHGAQFIYNFAPATPDTTGDHRSLYSRMTATGTQAINETVGFSSYNYHEAAGGLAIAYGSTNQVLNRSTSTITTATGSFNQARQQNFAGVITLARGSLNAVQNYRSSGVGITTGYGAHNKIEAAADGGTITTGYGSYNEILITTASTVSAGTAGLFAVKNKHASGAIVTAVSVHAYLDNDGAVTNYNAILIDEPIGVAPSGTNYAIRSLSTAQSLFQGSVGIGATALSSTSFRVSKSIAGATTSSAIRADGTIQSGVTIAANIFTSAVSTAAASFTLGALTHFSVDQGTFGASSTVTDQYGFRVSSSMTGAGTNYGFASGLAAGSNRWNFYASGTAQNYFAGVTGIGINASSTATLALAASSTGTASIRLTHGVAPSSPVDGDMWTTTAGLYVRINGGTIGPLS